MLPKQIRHCVFLCAGGIWDISGIRFIRVILVVQVIIRIYLHNEPLISRPKFSRQKKVNSELNNMLWRIRPDDVLIEVGRLFGSKTGLQKLNYEVDLRLTETYSF